MHALLPCHEKPESLHDQGLRRQFVLDAPPEEPLDHFRPMVKNESHDAFLIKVS